MTNHTLDRPFAGDSTNENSRSQAATPPISSADIRALVEPVEELILKYPAAALASAFVLGVALAWWIKRK